MERYPITELGNPGVFQQEEVSRCQGPLEACFSMERHRCRSPGRGTLSARALLFHTDQRTLLYKTWSRGYFDVAALRR